jgi:hypothetical protein
MQHWGAKGDCLLDIGHFAEELSTTPRKKPLFPAAFV